MAHSDPDIPKLNIDLVEQQLRLWETRRLAEMRKSVSEADTRYRYLTIARNQGSLGDDIAQALSKRLGWHIFDKEIVSYIAQSAHVREILVRQLDQRAQGLLQDTIARLLRMVEFNGFGSDEYHETLLKTLVCLAKQGSAIVLGRGANFVLRDDPQGLSVRITASTAVRARRIAEEWGVSDQEAARRLRENDEEQREFIRQYFHHDFDDVCFYDLVITTDRISVEQATDSIMSILKPDQAVFFNRSAPASVNATSTD